MKTKFHDESTDLTEFIADRLYCRVSDIRILFFTDRCGVDAAPLETIGQPRQFLLVPSDLEGGEKQGVRLLALIFWFGCTRSHKTRDYNSLKAEVVQVSI